MTPTISDPDLIDRADRHASPVETLLRGSAAILASLVVGCVLAAAQGFLPDALRSFANSCSGITIVALGLLWVTRVRLPWAALVAPATMAAMMYGYTLAWKLQGLYYNPTRWVIIGILVGPFVGIAAVWLRGRDWRAALATVALAGILVGEAVFGLTVIAETTSPVYWSAIGVLGLALVAFMVLRRIRHLPTRLLTLGGSIVAAAVYSPLLDYVLNDLLG